MEGRGGGEMMGYRAISQCNLGRFDRLVGLLKREGRAGGKYSMA